MVTLTRAVPILVYEPQPETTFSPGMAGTVKSCVPEAVFVAEAFGLGEGVACGELSECVAVTEGSAAAECVFVGVGDGVSAGVGVAAAVATWLVAGPLVAADTTGAELAPHAVRPAPPMTAAMITAGTRHILMLL